jgi:hypothetical protein
MEIHKLLKLLTVNLVYSFNPHFISILLYFLGLVSNLTLPFHPILNVISTTLILIFVLILVHLHVLYLFLFLRPLGLAIDLILALLHTLLLL